jgi:F-type H+-transporting ATPase subunit a
VAKRRILGMPTPVAIIVAVIAIVILAIGFFAGPIGSKFVSIDFPSWLVVEDPEVHLPAPELFHIFGLPVTNSLLASWLTALFLIIGSILITRRMKLVPGRVQGIFEAVLGYILDFCTSIAGEKNGRRFFPVIITIFLYVLFNAWLSLIPGFVSVEYTLHGHTYELFRGANTDINTPLAIALISFVFVEYYGLRSLGIGYLSKFLNFGTLFRGIGKLFTGRLKEGLSGMFSGAIDAFVGALEGLSEFIRIVSFSFRLFGNMTAGEILLLIVAYLVPMAISFIFYGLELFVGLIQAFIFAGLTLVFVNSAVTAHSSEEH